jgi:membrane-associated phospholipid phosphatase
MKIPVFFFLQMLLASSLWAQSLDINVLKQVHGKRNQNYDAAFIALSDASTYVHAALPIGYAAYGILKKDSNAKRKALQSVIGMGINGVSTYLIKVGINRPRPQVTYPQYINALAPYTRNSFPSGHTSTAFNTATLFSLHTRKWYYVVPAYTYASAVAYSRMHMGVHYPTDVFTGALLGTTSALISNHFTRLLQTHRSTRKTYKKFIQ